MTTRVLLIRHGQTDWNVKGIYQGYTDIPLNAKGRAQAGSLRPRMKKEKVDAVWSSDRKRALQSARIIFKNKPIKIERNLREISFGVFEGLTHEDIMTKYPKIYSRWAAKPFKVKIPGGEAPAAFKKRVLSAFKNIVRAAKGRTIAIVTHGGVIYAITGEMLKPGEYFEWVR